MFYFKKKTLISNYIVADLGLSNSEIDNFRNLFEDENCADLINVATVNEENSEHKRKGEIIWLTENLVNKTPIRYTIEKILSVVKEINDNYFEFDLDSCEMLQLTRYQGDNSDYFDLHTDSESECFLNCRKLSFIIQLSDLKEYEGGDFYFINDNLKETNPEYFSKGKLIVFPSYCNHGVCPVSKGVRYSLVGWCRGPKFR